MAFRKVLFNNKLYNYDATTGIMSEFPQQQVLSDNNIILQIPVQQQHHCNYLPVVNRGNNLNFNIFPNNPNIYNIIINNPNMNNINISNPNINNNNNMNNNNIIISGINNNMLLNQNAPRYFSPNFNVVNLISIQGNNSNNNNINSNNYNIFNIDPNNNVITNDVNLYDRMLKEEAVRQSTSEASNGNEEIDNKLTTVGDGKKYYYHLVKKIGSGGFGEVHLGINMSNRSVAVKLESLDSPNILLLAHEYKMFRILKGSKLIPKAHWFGQNGNFNVLVLDILGEDLASLFKKCNSEFSVKTILMLGKQILDIMEYIHSKNIIHRDIKPENFLMGVGRNSNQLYLVDFGLAKEYINKFTGKHIKLNNNDEYSGTPCYSSVNALARKTQSRRDDLESVGHVLLSFIKKDLPWFNMNSDDDGMTKTWLLKATMTVDEMCHGLPYEFAMYFNYCRRLKFSQDPNYAYLKMLFSNMMAIFQCINDGCFDWTEAKRKRGTKRQGSSTEEDAVSTSKRRRQN